MPLAKECYNFGYIQDATGTVTRLRTFLHALFVTFMSNMNNYSFRSPSPRLLHTLGPFRACFSGGYWPTSVAVFPGVVFAILFYGFETRLWPVNPTKRQGYFNCIYHTYSVLSMTYTVYMVYNHEKNNDNIFVLKRLYKKKMVVWSAKRNQSWFDMKH